MIRQRNDSVKLVQKVLERKTLKFFLLMQSNIFSTAIKSVAVDICGQDRKVRHYFLEVGQKIKLSARLAISRHLQALSGRRKLESVGLKQLKELLLNGLLMKLVMVCECELYTNRLQDRLLLPFLMKLPLHSTNQLSRICVRGSCH